MLRILQAMFASHSRINQSVKVTHIPTILFFDDFECILMSKQIRTKYIESMLFLANKKSNAIIISHGKILFSTLCDD